MPTPKPPKLREAPWETWKKEQDMLFKLVDARQNVFFKDISNDRNFGMGSFGILG
jgi:hypothetical protein